jgi:hypothetical protein
VAKSNRRRKQDRAKRADDARRREARERRQREAEAYIAEIEARHELMHDPATPVEAVAKLIAESHPGEPVSPLQADLLARKRGHDDVAAIVDALFALDPPDAPSPTSLTFAALAAAGRGDHAQARDLLDRAMTADPDWLGWTRYLRATGRVAETLERLADTVDDPEAEQWNALQGHTLTEAQQRLTGPPQLCTCGSGAAYAQCCGPRERAALDRFADRSTLYALRVAVGEHLTTSPHAGVVAEWIEDWMKRAGFDGLPDDTEEPLLVMATEYAWTVAGGEGNETVVLDDLAADPATPPAVAAAARNWARHTFHGLWQLTDPEDPGPGRWCTEVCTGRDLYISFAPEQIEDLPRWAVLLGSVTPIDGAWRSGGALLQLSPGEADAVCEAVRDAALVVADSLSGRTSRRCRRGPAPLRFGEADPHTVLAGYAEPSPPEVADLLSRVLGVMVPSLYAELTAARSVPPQLTNTDGDPMELISARIAVADPDDLARRLAAHPDLDPHDGPDVPAGERRFAWQGPEVPPDHRAEMLARVRDQFPDEAILDTPSRWVLAQLRLTGRTLRVEVNSQRRLDRLLALLTDLGAAPDLVETTRVDPRQDLPWAPRTLRTGPPPPRAGEEQAWLDTPLRDLRGRSPRQAAGKDRLRLQAMLRQFEYDADVSGLPGCDTALLWAELGIEP